MALSTRPEAPASSAKRSSARVRVGRVEQDRGRVGLGAQCAAELDAVLVAQAMVEDHHVWAGAAQQDPHRRAVLRAADAAEAGLGAKHGFEACTQNGVVVDDENADHGEGTGTLPEAAALVDTGYRTICNGETRRKLRSCADQRRRQGAR